MVNTEKQPSPLPTDTMTEDQFRVYAGLCLRCGRNRQEFDSNLCEPCQAIVHSRTQAAILHSRTQAA